MINTLVLPRPGEALKFSSTKFDLSRKSKYRRLRMELTLTQPDDWHLHLHDFGVFQFGNYPSGRNQFCNSINCAKHFGRAVVMPNLKPPITTTAAAIAYQESILTVLPADGNFTVLMTLYLTDKPVPMRSSSVERAELSLLLSCTLLALPQTLKMVLQICLGNIYQFLKRWLRKTCHYWFMERSQILLLMFLIGRKCSLTLFCNL